VIKFENKRTGEVAIFTGEQEVNMRNAHMAAYLNSSDMGPNSGVRGQDFGWRLSPEVVVSMDEVRGDYEALDTISRKLGVPIDGIKDFHILSYVADKEFAKDAMEARAEVLDDSAAEEAYEARVKAAREARKNATIEVSTANKKGK
jgi:hypothetical protein